MPRDGLSCTPVRVTRHGLNPAQPLIMNRKTIYLADDDPDDIELVWITLHELFPEVELVPFRDGQYLIDHLRNERSAEPWFFVLDYSMPLCDGPGVLKWLKNSSFKNIPSFILSTSPVDHHKTNCLQAGARAYFTKPSSHLEFKFLVSEMIRQTENA